jgi:serine/threonine protein kinase
MPLGMLGKYERLDVLGHGVSGIVYLAKDTLLNKQVALKEVDVQAGDLRRFLEEARVMDRLRHPNIVRVNNVDRIEGKVIIDMEYVRGANLQEVLRQEGPLPLDRALDIAAQVLDALEYAHSMQTVHRDIKPANILIGRDGSVKLVDFGLAEILATNAYAGGAGTYAYMAPEDFAEEDRSDNQSDIWALGVTLYEMLSGERPFQVTKVKDPFSWKRALETQTPAPIEAYLPDAPEGLQAILTRALARDKRDRYRSAGDFRNDVLRLRSGRDLDPTTLRLGRLLRGNRLKGGGVQVFRRSGIQEDSDALQDHTETAYQPEQSNSRTPEHPNTQTPYSPLPRPHIGPEIVVADVNELIDVPGAATTQRGRRPFLGRKAAARLTVDPAAVDFGAVRKGELRTVKLQARIMGTEGKATGSVMHTPGWLTVFPTAFDRTRQTITLTAHTARAWETGEFTETVRIESNAGTVEIPVHLTVLKPRASFAQVSLWFVPLFAATLLPALAVAFGSGSVPISALGTSLVPAAAVASGLLAMMLLFISIAADIGMAERVACGVLITIMCFVLGMSAAAHPAYLADSQLRGLIEPGMRRAYATGGILGSVLLLQMLHLRRWKLWAVVVTGLGLCFGGTLLQLIMHKG